MEFNASMIAEYLHGTIEGDKNITVTNISRIEEGKTGTLAFLSNPKYNKYLYNTGASLVLVNNDFKLEAPVSCTLIRVENAYEAFASLLTLYQQSIVPKTGIESPSFINSSAKLGTDVYVGAFAYISANVSVGNHSRIYPQVFLGDNVKVGENVIIYAGAKIYDNCDIGNNCIVHAGVVLGADGFGFAPREDGTYEKIPQIGNVVLEENVEIGANTTIDSSTMGSTVIHKGAKIDNLIQIAHNCEVGENTVMAAMTGVAGSTKIGNNCMFGGHVGIAGHIKIGNGVKVGAMTGIDKSVKDGKTIMGLPAMPYDRALKAMVLYRNLPDMHNDVVALKKELKELKKQLKK